jgi:flagellum-specific ATP synthase
MGDITGLITVLVDGDDHDEPIADAVRGILDGHCVMDRKIAERGRYPAINVLRSLSRMVPQCLTPWEQRVAREVRKRLADYEDMAELIRIGAYQPGSDPAVDLARVEVPKIEALLTQMPESKVKRSDAYRALAEIVGIEIVGVENDDEAASGAIVEAERRTLIGSAASGDA